MRYLSSLFLCLLGFTSVAQCDLELLSVDFAAGTYTVAFNNTNNCGGTGGPDGVSEIQIGFQALDPENDCAAMNQGWTFPSGISIPDDNNHPGWIYTSTTSEIAGSWTNLYTDDVDPPYYTGDTVTFPIYNVYQNDCVDGFWATYLSCQMQDALQFWIDEGLSIQAVIWQISYGPTVYADEGGWAEVGPNGDGTNWGTGLYEDLNFQDNWLILGPCGEEIPVVITDTIYIELPPDTVYQTLTVYDTTYITLPPDTIEYYFNDTTYLTDTTYIDVWYYTTDTIYQIDTLIQFVELPPDTLYQVDYLYDTTYVYLTDTTYVFDTTYVYQTDTIYEYLIQEIWIDCSTGDLCDEDPPGIEEDQVVYVPNAFSPNNDGVNDAFFAVTKDPDFWLEWEMIVFSRWGDIVFRSFDPNQKWDGSVREGSHFSPNGVYSWIINAKGERGVSIRLKGSVVLIN